MRRRDFIKFVGGAAAASTLPSFAARAQQAERPLVAVVFSGSADGFADQTAAFRNGLGETGYLDGRNVTVAYHGLSWHYENLLLRAFGDSIRLRRVTVYRYSRQRPGDACRTIGDNNYSHCFRRG